VETWEEVTHCKTAGWWNTLRLRCGAWRGRSLGVRPSGEPSSRSRLAPRGGARWLAWGAGLEVAPAPHLILKHGWIKSNENTVYLIATIEFMKEIDFGSRSDHHYGRLGGEDILAWNFVDKTNISVQVCCGN